MQMPRGWMLLAVTLVLAGYAFAGSRNRPLKVASLDIDRAVFDTDQGKRGAKQFEQDQADLKTMSTEIESRKKRLKDHAQEMSDADRRTIQTEIDFLQTNLDSSTHRVKEDQSARLKLRDSIIQKMAPIVVRLAQQKHMNAILDASPRTVQDPSKDWPDGLILWYSGPNIDLKEASSTKPETDITDEVVRKYNAEHP